MLHESLRELLEARGVEVISDADEFRGVLDDFLHEDEATVGELNLLVDAVRLGAVHRFLTIVDQGGEPAAAARDAGMTLARDRGTDDPARSRWAVAAIGYAVGKVPDAVVREFRAAEGTVPVPSPPLTPVTPAPAPAPEVPVPATPVPTPPATPARPTTQQVPPTTEIPVHHLPLIGAPVRGRRRRGLLAALTAVVLVAVIAGGVWWTQMGDDPNSRDSSSPDRPGVPIADDEIVLALGRPDDTRLYRVNAETGEAAELTKGPEDSSPALAPDRRSMVILRGVDAGKIPYLFDVVTGSEEQLFPSDGPCARADRVAWSPDGTRLATVCVTRNNKSMGLYVADVTDDLPLEPKLVADDDAKGLATWVSGSSLVYQRMDGDTSSGLWSLDVDAGGEPERLTPEDGQFAGQPDHSVEAGRILFLVRSASTGPGFVWAMNTDGSDRTQLSTRLVLYPVWSPDGEQVAYLTGQDDDELTVADADDVSGGITVDIDQEGAPGPPVWGSP